MLIIKSVKKLYQTTAALDGVSLTIPDGEFFGLLGPNGAGKSTLMSIICGLRLPNEGDISFDGVSLLGARAGIRSQMGLAPQQLALYPTLSAGENLRIFGRLCGLSGAVLERRLTEALQAVGLEERRDLVLRKFSGGMARRLNLAVATLHQPRLLLCDEPTAGVDPQSRQAIFGYLRELNQSGTTVIYTTHYMEEAAQLCHRIAILDHGRVHAVGTLPELLALLPAEEELEFAAEPATEPLARDVQGWGDVKLAANKYRCALVGSDQFARFYTTAAQFNLQPHLFTTRRPDLERVFLHLTGKALRD